MTSLFPMSVSWMLAVGIALIIWQHMSSIFRILTLVKTAMRSILDMKNDFQLTLGIRSMPTTTLGSILIDAFVYSSLFFSIKEKALSPYDQKQADITWPRVIETRNIEWRIVIKPLLTFDCIKLKVMLDIKEEYSLAKTLQLKTIYWAQLIDKQ